MHFFPIVYYELNVVIGVSIIVTLFHFVSSVTTVVNVLFNVISISIQHHCADHTLRYDNLITPPSRQMYSHSDHDDDIEPCSEWLLQ